MAKAKQHTVFDTGHQYLGSVYAKALIGAGQKSGDPAVLVEQLTAVVGTLDELPDFEAVLSSPRVPLESKEKTLDQAFGGKVAPSLLNFLKVLARRGRFDCLPAIERSARQQLNQLLGRLEVQVETADELDEQAVADVKSKLTERLGQDVELDLSVNSDLIAGLVVRVGDTVYDGSLSNRLHRLRKEMVGSTAERLSRSLDQLMAE